MNGTSVSSAIGGRRVHRDRGGHTGESVAWARKRPPPARVYLHTLGCPEERGRQPGAEALLGAAGVVVRRRSRSRPPTSSSTRAASSRTPRKSRSAPSSTRAPRTRARAVLVDGLPGGALSRGAAAPASPRWRGGSAGRRRGRAGAAPSARGSTRPVGRGADGESGAAAPAPDRRRCRASYAYLKISDGCDEPCTFCAIPGIKGAYHSFAAEEILREADACLAEGARELVLVGQDTSLWSGGRRRISPGLIDLLAADERVRRIRVMYLQPEHVTDAFLQLHGRRSPSCAATSTCPSSTPTPRCCSAWAAGGTASAYLDLLERARRLMPDVSVRSAFIVGFPGETERAVRAPAGLRRGRGV